MSLHDNKAVQASQSSHTMLPTWLWTGQAPESLVNAEQLQQRCP